MNTKILLSIAIASVSLTGCLGLENLNSNNDNNNSSPPPADPASITVGGCTRPAYNVHLNPNIYPVIGNERLDVLAMGNDTISLRYSVMDSTNTKTFTTATSSNPLYVIPGMCSAQLTKETIIHTESATAGPLDNQVITLTNCSYPVDRETKNLHFTANYRISNGNDYTLLDTKPIGHGTLEFDCYAGDIPN